MKRRNGRPRIVPPDDLGEAADEVMPDPRMLRAIARAWDWRRRLERGEVTTLADIAQAENVTTSFVSRVIRLAYLSPEVLERLLIYRRPCAVSIDELTAAALAPWLEQTVSVLDDQSWSRRRDGLLRHRRERPATSTLLRFRAGIAEPTRTRSPGTRLDYASLPAMI